MPIPSKNIRAERIIGTLDASEFNISGNLLISGNTQINGGLTANTISATTIYADYIDFNTGATVTSSNGRIYWDSGTGTLNVSVGDTGTGLIDLQVGQEEIVRVFNDEATTLQKGEIVYVSGSQGNRPAVKRAQATSDGYSVTTLGMVDRNIASGAEGYVTTFGIGMFLRDTSLKFQQQGLDMTRAALSNMTKTTTVGAFNANNIQNPYLQEMGGQKEDLRWLL